MTDNAFLRYRNEIIASMNKHCVAYKLVGGTVVQLIDDTRETSDLDLMMRRSEENIENLIQALVDCGFATVDDLREQIFADNDEDFTSFQIVPSKPEWAGFHIDLCYSLGQFNYDTLPEAKHETTDGLVLNSVPFLTIVRMKANVFPKPRPQDIKDIQVIADYLGLDPATGQPIGDASAPR
jgi:predicted nucleotidyltransferase